MPSVCKWIMIKKQKTDKTIPLLLPSDDIFFVYTLL